MTDTDRELLLLPGPTPVPPDLAGEMARPLINHRGPQFATGFHDCVAGLQWAFQTREEVFILTGSGTSAMEAAIVNTLSPGDPVLAVSAGAFGDRFGQIARAFGAEVEPLGFPWGEPIDPAVVRKRLHARPFRAILTILNETSTGVLHDLSDLAGAHDALLIVDAISGVLVADLPMDAWGIDVCVAASHKAFSMPPGLAFIAVSARARAAEGSARMPRFYFNFATMREFATRGQTPYTPAISQVVTLRAALARLRAEGLPALQAHHTRRAAAVRRGVEALGLSLFARGSFSPAVTAVHPPPNIAPRDLLAHLRDEYALVLAAGQAHLADRVFRIGHLGLLPDEDAMDGLGRLGRGLHDLGWEVDPDAGAAAAEAHLAASAA